MRKCGGQLPLHYNNMNNYTVLSLFDYSGNWSKPYRDAGYNVIQIDEKLGQDILKWDYSQIKSVYGILAAPPCPMFSFCRTNAKTPRDLRLGMLLVNKTLEIIWHFQYEITKDTQKYSPLKFWAIENVNRGMLKWFLGKPAFTFNPYDFGDNYKKDTALWGYFNEPKKSPIVCNAPKFDKLNSKDIHSEYYGKMDRKTRRSITPLGFAYAFYEANK